jgi:hypothetical protein
VNALEGGTVGPLGFEPRPLHHAAFAEQGVEHQTELGGRKDVRPDVAGVVRRMNDGNERHGLGIVPPRRAPRQAPGGPLQFLARMATPTPFRPAFAALERASLRRAFARIEPVVWLEIAAIAALAAGFVFWKVHVGLASLAHDRGPVAAAGQLAAELVLLALGGGALVGARHAVRLRSADGAPPWLSLPLPEPALAAHLASMSRIQSRWMLVPAGALIVAASGVLPWIWMAALALAFLAVFDLAGRAACRLALAAAAVAVPPHPALGALGRVLAHTGRSGVARRRSAARWARMRPGLALWLNDLRLARRDPATRRRAIFAALSLALSCAAWRLPVEPPLAHLAAFALALIAAATVAEWLISTIGADPADVLRALPIGLGAAWGARFAWVVVAASALVAGHALAARGVEPAALRFFLVCVGLAALAIGTLGVNYGVSLYPHAVQAQRMLALTLGLAVASSLMVPLMGWIVLLTAVLHSLRRVQRWARAEER